MYSILRKHFFCFTNMFFQRCALQKGRRLMSMNEMNMIKSAVNQDVLLQQLRRAPSAQNVLELVASHYKIMNNKQLLQAFRTLFILQKTSYTQATDITSDPAFRTLCVSLKRQIRATDLNDLVEALKILSFLGVPANSTVTQTVLQMVRQNINAFSLHQLIFLDFILRQTDATPLSDALLIALPIVFDAQLPTKLDRDNLVHLTDCLQYTAHKNRDQPISDATLTHLLKCIDAHCELKPLRVAVSLVWSLCEIQPHRMRMFAPLLQRALDTIVAQDIYDGQMVNKFEDLETTLSKLIVHYNANNTFYFHPKFFQLVAEYVVQHDLGFQRTVWILQKFLKIGYTSTSLLEYLSSLLLESNSDLIEKSNAWTVFVLVSAFAASEHCPPRWEHIRQSISRYSHFESIKFELNWMKFAARLAMLNIYSLYVLEMAFRKEYLEKIIRDGNSANCRHFLLLYQIVSVLNPKQRSLLPHSDVVQSALRQVVIDQTEKEKGTVYEAFQAALEQGFGGQTYVLSNVATKLGHFVHHVVVMRKGGYPIAFHNLQKKPFITLEELKIPEDSRVIAIIACNKSYYQPESNVFKNFYNFTFRTIRACNYAVVPVSIEMWANLPDFEKIPYLMQLIKIENEQHENAYAVQW